jgi:hypothetical protein
MKISTTNIILIVLIMVVTRKKCSKHFENSLPTSQLKESFYGHLTNLRRRRRQQELQQQQQQQQQHWPHTSTEWTRSKIPSNNRCAVGHSAFVSVWGPPRAQLTDRCELILSSLCNHYSNYAVPGIVGLHSLPRLSELMMTSPPAECTMRCDAVSGFTTKRIMTSSPVFLSVTRNTATRFTTVMPYDVKSSSAWISVQWLDSCRPRALRVRLYIQQQTHSWISHFHWASGTNGTTRVHWADETNGTTRVLGLALFVQSL